MKHVAFLTILISTSSFASQVYRCEKNETNVQSVLGWFSTTLRINKVSLPSVLDYSEGAVSIRVETSEPSSTYPQHGNYRVVRIHPVEEVSRQNGEITINVFSPYPVSGYLCEMSGSSINYERCVSENADEGHGLNGRFAQFDLENGSLGTANQSGAMNITIINNKPYTKVLYREHVLKNPQAYICRQNNAVGNGEITSKEETPFIPTIINDEDGAQGNF